MCLSTFHERPWLTEALQRWGKPLQQLIQRISFHAEIRGSTDYGQLLSMHSLPCILAKRLTGSSLFSPSPFPSLYPLSLALTPSLPLVLPVHGREMHCPSIFHEGARLARVDVSQRRHHGITSIPHIIQSISSSRDHLIVYPVLGPSLHLVLLAKPAKMYDAVTWSKSPSIRLILSCLCLLMAHNSSAHPTTPHRPPIAADCCSWLLLLLLLAVFAVGVVLALLVAYGLGANVSCCFLWPCAAFEPRDWGNCQLGRSKVTCSQTLGACAHNPSCSRPSTVIHQSPMFAYLLTWNV